MTQTSPNCSTLK